jgi:hypothetical protein
VKVSAVVGVIMLLAVVAVVLVSTGSHATAGPTPGPTPSVVPMAAPATPQPSPEPLDVATGTMAHVAVIGWLIGLTALPLFVLIGIALHARHRSKLLELEHPPLRDREAVHRIYDVRSLEARRGWLPESLTYHYSTRNEPAIEVDASTPALPDHMLTADQALGIDGIVYGQRLDTGEPLVEQRVLSLAIGGRTGAGKTSTALLLAVQYARTGAELRVCDPHSGHPGSLVTQLERLMSRPTLGWIAETPRETLLLVDEVAEQLERRKAGWRRHNGQQRPLVLLVDEFAENLRLLPPRDRERLLDLIQVIGYSGRKFGVASVLLAQSWLTGGVYTSQVRNPLQAAIVHAMRADEGRALTGLQASAWPSDPMQLPPGEAFTVGIGGSGLLRIRVPLLGSASGSTAAPDRLQTGSTLMLDGTDSEPDRSQDGADLEPGDMRVAELFKAGADVPEIVRKLHGVDSSSGSKYQRASREVQAALRRAFGSDN